MARAARFFVTGTDTDAGKTLVACGLLAAASAQGLRTLALKPVAAGAEKRSGELRNDDALNLMAAMSEKLSYAQVNPVVFEEAIAPHIAADHEERRLTAAQLAGYCRGSMMHPADFLLVEGAGGWRVPLNHRGFWGNAGCARSGTEPAGDSGGGDEAGLHQSRPVNGRRDSRRWPVVGRLGGQPC